MLPFLKLYPLAQLTSVDGGAAQATDNRFASRDSLVDNTKLLVT